MILEFSFRLNLNAFIAYFIIQIIITAFYEKTIRGGLHPEYTTAEKNSKVSSAFLPIFATLIIIVVYWQQHLTLNERRILYLAGEIESSDWIKILNIIVIVRAYTIQPSKTYAFFFCGFLLSTSLLNANRGLLIFFGFPYLMYHYQFKLKQTFITLILLALVMAAVTNLRSGSADHALFMYRNSLFLPNSILDNSISGSIWPFIHYATAPIFGLLEAVNGELIVEAGYSIYALGFSMTEVTPTRSVVPTMVAPFYSYILGETLLDSLFIIVASSLLVWCVKLNPCDLTKLCLLHFVWMGIFTVPFDFPFSVILFVAGILSAFLRKVGKRHYAHSN